MTCGSLDAVLATREGVNEVPQQRREVLAHVEALPDQERHVRVDDLELLQTGPERLLTHRQQAWVPALRPYSLLPSPGGGASTPK